MMCYNRSMDSISDKVVEKIKKLLALARSDNEHEASRAAEQAHKLLLRHNLTEQTVKERPSSDYSRLGVDRRIFARVEDKFVDGLLQQFFFVKVVMSRHARADGGGGNSNSAWYERDTILIGTKPNIEVAAYVRQFLIDKFRKLWLEYKRETGSRPRAQQSYYLGLTKGLSNKLKEQQRRVEDEMALILVRDPMLDELVKHIRNKSTSSIRADQETIEDGIEDGKKIKIQRSLEEKSTISGRFIEVDCAGQIEAEDENC